jgi:hypothetical protein
LANKPLNSTVRASKKGEILVMHKMGICKADGQALAPGQPRPQLALVFAGALWMLSTLPHNSIEKFLE